jgi:hypothetical protein
VPQADIGTHTHTHTHSHTHTHVLIFLSESLGAGAAGAGSSDQDPVTQMLGIAGQVFVWVCGCVGVWAWVSAEKENAGHCGAGIAWL